MLILKHDDSLLQIAVYLCSRVNTPFISRTSVCLAGFYRILERLPVIVEEYTDWQRDFWDLQTKQAHYGAKFPAEMGFKYDEEESLTMEQVLEQSPVPLAPRR